MKIATLYSDSPFASWSQSRGFPAVLRRMGHEVTEIPVPQGYKGMKQIARSLVERANQPINDCELVIVSGPEHLQQWITQFYPRWKNLKIPRVAHYHESFVREDYRLNYEDFAGLYDFHFFPDQSDAEKYKGEFLSLGVDTEMFKPLPVHDVVPGEPCNWRWENEKCWCGYSPEGRDIDAAFIGLMYPKRQRFAQQLGPHIKGIDFRVANGSILVQDLDGVNIRRSMELLAEQYRRVKVFFAFPSLSNVLVAKPLEAGACGCLVMVANAHGLKNVCTYDESKPEEAANMVRNWLQYPEQARAAKAQELQEEIHQHHRMELRFETIFKKVGIACQESSSPAAPASLATISYQPFSLKVIPSAQ